MTGIKSMKAAYSVKYSRSQATQNVKTVGKTTGLRYWMLRVLEECEHVSADFSADPVHDLRVALRRCRSMADGMMAMDPDREWKAMKQAGKRLFQSLGTLRDVQIMMEWIERLYPQMPDAAHASPAGTPDPTDLPLTDSATSPGHDPSAQALHTILRARESEQKQQARAALQEFDRKQWRQWSDSLPQRAARVRPGSAVFKHLALERWTTARELHTRAMRNRSQVALHTLRIGIKRFRYIVENFLPEEHKAWSNELKHMQDLLGEVHDLDVLWATALSYHVFPEAASRQVWHSRILEERKKRVEEYRQHTIGPDSLWNVWRGDLPQGKQIEQIATRRMKLWAKALDPDFAHSERVARLSLELYDGLTTAGLLSSLVGNGRNGTLPDARASVYLAALLHDVGKAKGNRGHHKESLELIKAHGTPLGWKPTIMARAGVVARFHCGALPTRSHKALRDLLPDEQKITIQLAAILRLANAFDAAHDGHIRRLRIENEAAQPQAREQRTNGFLRRPARLTPTEALIVGAEGFVASSPTAQTVAAERYLLETVLRRPIVIRPLHNSPPRRVVSQSRQLAS